MQSQETKKIMQIMNEIKKDIIDNFDNPRYLEIIEKLTKLKNNLKEKENINLVIDVLKIIKEDEIKFNIKKFKESKENNSTFYSNEQLLKILSNYIK